MPLNYAITAIGTNSLGALMCSSILKKLSTMNIVLTIAFACNLKSTKTTITNLTKQDCKT